MVSFLNHISSILYERGRTCGAVYLLFLYSWFSLTIAHYQNQIASAPHLEDSRAPHTTLLLAMNALLGLSFPPLRLGSQIPPWQPKEAADITKPPPSQQYSSLSTLQSILISCPVSVCKGWVPFKKAWIHIFKISNML